MQMRKVIAVLGLSLAAVAIGGMPTRAAEDRPLGLKPPALVSCADAQHCDRDPAHLVNFVTKFYAWYVDNAVAEAVLTGAARDQNARTQKRILDRMLSPPFLANLAKLSKEVAAAHGEIPEIRSEPLVTVRRRRRRQYPVRPGFRGLLARHRLGDRHRGAARPGRADRDAAVAGGSETAAATIGGDAGSGEGILADRQSGGAGPLARAGSDVPHPQVCGDLLN